jgi:hypothetical protein
LLFVHVETLILEYLYLLELELLARLVLDPLLVVLFLAFTLLFFLLEPDSVFLCLDPVILKLLQSLLLLNRFGNRVTSSSWRAALLALLGLAAGRTRLFVILAVLCSGATQCRLLLLLLSLLLGL